MGKNSKSFVASAAIEYNLTKEGRIMEDYFDDFEEHFEDSLKEDFEKDEQFADDFEFEDETDPAESKDGKFTASDAFIVGGALGYAYHEGTRERRRRKRRKLSDESD
jgi:hypothetical protein